MGNLKDVFLPVCIEELRICSICSILVVSNNETNSLLTFSKLEYKEYS